MKYRKLGNTGLDVSEIGFGGIPIQRTTLSGPAETISEALQRGINLFDTARAYSDSEYKLGRALKEERTQAIVATKSLVRDKAEIKPGMENPQEVKENVSLGGEKLSWEEEKRLFDEVESLGSKFCRRCEYCQPCPEGIDIIFNMLQHSYWKHYGLQKWAPERYHMQKVKPSACVECGQCEERCPYNLPIREMLKECCSYFENGV